MARRHSPNDSKHVAVIVADAQASRQLDQWLRDGENDWVKVVAVHQERQGNQRIHLLPVHDLLHFTHPPLSDGRFRILGGKRKNQTIVLAVGRRVVQRIVRRNFGPAKTPQCQFPDYGIFKTRSLGLHTLLRRLNKKLM